MPPRTDPPPRKITESFGSPRPADPGAGDALSQEIAYEDAEITTGVEEISLEGLSIDDDPEEISLEELSIDDDPDSSERVTVIPPIPEHEYVAQMMRELPVSDAVTTARPGTPPRSMTPPLGSAAIAPSPSSSRRPSPFGRLGSERPPSSGPQRRSESAAPPTVPSEFGSAESMPPLTLDFDESIPPGVPSHRAPKVESRSPAPPEPKTETRRSVPFEPPVETKLGLRDLPTRRPRSPAPAESPPNLPSLEPRSFPQPPLPKMSEGPPSLDFGPTSGDALELVGVRAQSVKPPRSPSVTMREVRDRFDVGDFSGALTLAEAMLEDDSEHVDALLYAEHCRDVLKPMYVSRLGGTGRVLAVAVGPDKMRWLSLDHRAGFLLSLVDGRSTIEELLDMSGMTELEALKLLLQLMQQDVIRAL